MKIRNLKIPLYFHIISFIFIIFLYFDSTASNPISSIKLDRYELYGIDEVLHYCYAKSAMYHPIALINPFAKVGFTASCLLFLKIFTKNIISLRIMNSIYSMGVLILMAKIGSILKMSRKAILLSIILVICFPLFFLGSISVLSEMMFSFVLLLAILLMYKEKYLFSSLTISFLPLINQLGFIYLFVWMVYLIKKRRVNLSMAIFIPVILWTISNTVLLGHPLFYTLYYRPILMPLPPQDGLVATREFMNFYFVLLSPLSILFILTLLKKRYLKDSNIHLIQVAIFVQLLQFILNIFIIPYYYSHAFAYKLRFLIPALPFMAIVASFLFEQETMNYKSKKLQKYIYVFIIIFSVFYFPYSMGKLQKFAVIKNEILSLEQEKVVIEAGRWLNDYIDNRNITAILSLGSEIPSPVFRRIWMQIPGEIIYYGLGRMDELPETAFNILTYKSSTCGHLKHCLFLVRNPNKVSIAPELKLVKAFPSVSLYFYGI